MMGSRINYSDEELAWIKAHSMLPRKEAHSKFCAKFNRNDVSQQNFEALCKRNRWMTGRTGHFEKYQMSWNKGKKMPFNANRAKTQFKKGDLPHNHRPLGHERITEDGYVEMSVDEVNPHTGYGHRYVLKHRYMWEQINGPVPDGMCLKSIDGDRANTNPENWMLISRSLLPRINGGKGGRLNYDQAEPELKPMVLAVAKLEQKASERRKGEDERVTS